MPLFLAQRGRNGQVLGACWLNSLEHMVSSKFSRDPSSERKPGNDRGEPPVHQSLVSTCTSTYALNYIQTLSHTQPTHTHFKKEEIQMAKSNTAQFPNHQQKIR